MKSWSLARHAWTVLVVCGLAVVVAIQLLAQQGRWVERAQRVLTQAQADSASPHMPLPGATARPDALRPEAWPSRAVVDEVVQQASRLAVKQGLALRSLSVVHQPASPSAWGKVTLEVSTTGDYAAYKAWQAGLMRQFANLGLQNLRLQAAAGAVGGLDAQWTWVLYVWD